MSLVERLEKLAKEFDQYRWSNGDYFPQKAEQCDLLKSAAQRIRELEAKCPT